MINLVFFHISYLKFPSRVAVTFELILTQVDGLGVFIPVKRVRQHVGWNLSTINR